MKYVFKTIIIFFFFSISQNLHSFERLKRCENAFSKHRLGTKRYTASNNIDASLNLRAHTCFIPPRLPSSRMHLSWIHHGSANKRGRNQWWNQARFRVPITQQPRQTSCMSGASLRARSCVSKQCKLVLQWKQKKKNNKRKEEAAWFFKYYLSLIMKTPVGLAREDFFHGGDKLKRKFYDPSVLLLFFILFRTNKSRRKKEERDGRDFYGVYLLRRTRREKLRKRTGDKID